MYENGIIMPPARAVLVGTLNDRAADATNKTPYRIFDMRGKVAILAIPFMPGSHLPGTIAQVVAVVEHLKRMHHLDFVHGDIRLLNMVFSNEKSELIDFDFSGKTGSTLYPLGYRGDLWDGTRPGLPGMHVTKSDDVESLVGALGNVVRGGS